MRHKYQEEEEEEEEEKNIKLKMHLRTMVIQYLFLAKCFSYCVVSFRALVVQNAPIDCGLAAEAVRN